MAQPWLTVVSWELIEGIDGGKFDLELSGSGCVSILPSEIKRARMLGEGRLGVKLNDSTEIKISGEKCCHLYQSRPQKINVTQYLAIERHLSVR